MAVLSLLVWCVFLSRCVCCTYFSLSNSLLLYISFFLHFNNRPLLYYHHPSHRSWPSRIEWKRMSWKNKRKKLFCFKPSVANYK